MQNNFSRISVMSQLYLFVSLILLGGKKTKPFINWCIVKPSPLAPLPQERGTRKYGFYSPSPAGEGDGG
jgi:hypothetical protein